MNSRKHHLKARTVSYQAVLREAKQVIAAGLLSLVESLFSAAASVA